MNQTISKKVRILAIAPSARGFGFSVMEDQAILESGNKGAKGNKNLHSLFKIEKLIKLFQPGIAAQHQFLCAGRKPPGDQQE